MEQRTFQTGFNLKRLVVKLGTGILTSGIGQIDTGVIENICQQIHRLRERGIAVIVVSSGAVGLGMGRLKLTKRPSDISTLQACASVGQSMLIETWQRAFDPWDIRVAQILLTRDDLSVRKRHVGVMQTIERLLSAGIIPVINENDSISIDELKFGDNDILSSLVSSLTKADLLVLLSTIPGLMNLETNEIIRTVESIDEDIMGLAQGTRSPTAVGGMISKLNAVHIATGSNCGVFIADGKKQDILLKLVDGEMEGTYFVPQSVELSSQKRWLSYFPKPSGNLVIDAGAERALIKDGSSLLAKGLLSVDGDFQTGDVVDILNPAQEIVARGITQYSAAELKNLFGMTSKQIRSVYPERKHTEVIHRNSLAIVQTQ